MIDSHLSHTGHHPHVEYDVNTVRNLDPDLAEARARRPHEEGNDIHRAAFHGICENLGKTVIGLRRGHPVIGRAGISFFLGAYKSKILRACDIVGGAPMEIASG